MFERNCKVIAKINRSLKNQTVFWQTYTRSSCRFKIKGFRMSMMDFKNSICFWSPGNISSPRRGVLRFRRWEYHASQLQNCMIKLVIFKYIRNIVDSLDLLWEVCVSLLCVAIIRSFASCADVSWMETFLSLRNEGAWCNVAMATWAMGLWYAAGLYCESTVIGWYH